MLWMTVAFGVGCLALGFSSRKAPEFFFGMSVLTMIYLTGVTIIDIHSKLAPLLPRAESAAPAQQQ